MLFVAGDDSALVALLEGLLGAFRVALYAEELVQVDAADLLLELADLKVVVDESFTP